jgi:hypothetical protein
MLSSWFLDALSTLDFGLSVAQLSQLLQLYFSYYLAGNCLTGSQRRVLT